MDRTTTALFLSGSLLVLGALQPALAADSGALIEKGRYLSILGNCGACHTPPNGMEMSGGVPIETPFGTLVASNITPDKETGIGNWTLEDFQKSMSEGIGSEGHMYPAMPYPAYTKVTAEDNAALWAYLQTLEPARNEVQSSQLSFPYDIRSLMIGWNLLNFTQGEYTPDPARSEAWNRGAYIVEGLGHCSTCHTPKNWMGADEGGQHLAGFSMGLWYAGDITSNAYSGIGDWTEDDVIAYMKNGRNRFDSASGPMAEVVEKSSRHWTDEDLQAVATYLTSTTSSATAAPAAVPDSDPRIADGADIYALYCSSCHTPDGEGIASVYPKLGDTSLVRGESAASLLKIVLDGSRKGVDTTLGAPGMPPYAQRLSDKDIADVLTFLRNRLGNAATAISSEDVQAFCTLLQQAHASKADNKQ